jgi:hypothetical protein
VGLASPCQHQVLRIPSKGKLTPFPIKASDHSGGTRAEGVRQQSTKNPDFRLIARQTAIWALFVQNCGQVPGCSANRRTSSEVRVSEMLWDGNVLAGAGYDISGAPAAIPAARSNLTAERGNSRTTSFKSRPPSQRDKMYE